MEKIVSLTQQQIDKFPLYVSEWTARGLTTTQKSQEDAERDFINFQRHVLKMENPAPVVIYDSPSKCREAVSPSCRTLSDAIKERFGGRDLKIVNIK